MAVYISNGLCSLVPLVLQLIPLFLLTHSRTTKIHCRPVHGNNVCTLCNKDFTLISAWKDCTFLYPVGLCETFHILSSRNQSQFYLVFGPTIQSICAVCGPRNGSGLGGLVCVGGSFDEPCTAYSTVSTLSQPVWLLITDIPLSGLCTDLLAHPLRNDAWNMLIYALNAPPPPFSG